MCSRIFMQPSAYSSQLLKSFNLDPLLPVRNNVAPCEFIRVIYNGRMETFIQDMRWSLPPSWNRKAHAIEKISDDKPPHQFFVDKHRRFRGIIPAHAFIEWRQEGQFRKPYYVQAANCALALAVMWDFKGGESSSASLVTHSQSPSIRSDDRFPLCLTMFQVKDWLDRNLTTDELLKGFGTTNIKLRKRPIDSSISNPQNKAAVRFLKSADEQLHDCGLKRI